MTTVRVYFNGHGCDAPAGATALEALRAHDPSLADLVSRGQRALADSRGLPVASDVPVYGGAIFRVISNRAARDANAPSGADA